MAYEWASRWVLSNFIGYKQTQYMFEKVRILIICFYPSKFSNHLRFFSCQYSADELGGYGGGGEYTVQPGFGWSNGVILDFLQMYGGRLTASAAGSIKPPSSSLPFIPNQEVARRFNQYTTTTFTYMCPFTSKNIYKAFKYLSNI